MKKLNLIILFFLLSTQAFAKGKMIYSFGGGTWGIKNPSQLAANGKPLIGEYNTDIFVRIGNEGALGKFFLHSVTISGMFTKAQAQYNYSKNSTTITDLNAEVTNVEGRAGFKFVPLPIFYLGGGVIIGNFKLNYDENEYNLQGGSSINEKLSEGQLMYGYYYELGLAIVIKNFGLRGGFEYARTYTDRFLTLGNGKLTFDANKVYGEIFWTM